MRDRSIRYMIIVASLSPLNQGATHLLLEPNPAVMTTNVQDHRFSTVL